MQAVEHVALRGPVQVLQGSEAAQDGRKRDEEETKKELSDYGRLHVLKGKRTRFLRSACNVAKLSPQCEIC